VSRRWRRWAWVVIVFAVVGRVIAGAGAAIDLTLALATGWTVGLLVLLAFGIRDRHPSNNAIGAAMTRAGLPLRELHPASVDARGSTPYFGTLDDGDRVFVKVLSSDERDADLLFRLYRRLRLRDVGDEAPFSSLRRTVEHEALVSLRATDLGVRTPHFLAVAPVDESSMLLAYEAIDGASLDSVPDDAITDAVLAELWQQVAHLRARNVAHRDLRLANVFLDTDEHPWLIDFGFSELAETDDVLASDVGELIVSTAFRVGPERAVTAAVAALGTDAVAAAAPRIQPLALSHATRSELKARKGFADDVRREIQTQCHLGEIEYEKLERISPRSLFLWLFGGIAVYVLIHQITNVAGAVEHVEDLDGSGSCRCSPCRS